MTALSPLAGSGTKAGGGGGGGTRKWREEVGEERRREKGPSASPSAHPTLPPQSCRRMKSWMLSSGPLNATRALLDLNLKVVTVGSVASHGFPSPNYWPCTKPDAAAGGAPSPGRPARLEPQDSNLKTFKKHPGSTVGFQRFSFNSLLQCPVSTPSG